MQISPYQLAFISGGFTVVGVLLGALITYRLALQLAKRNARREAGRRLREAFACELAALNPVSGDKGAHVEGLLDRAFPKHRAAVTEFSFYLSGSEREAFEEAWRTYYEVGGGVRFFDYHLGERPYELFRQRVHAILKFTDA